MSEEIRVIHGSVVRKDIQQQDRSQSVAQETANSLSHGIGLLLALAFAPVLLVTTVRQGQVQDLVGGILHGTWGWTLFGLIWGIAAIGIMLKAFDKRSNPLLSTALYLATDWQVAIAAVPLLERVSAAGMAWLVAGGLAYTVGVAFYLTDALDICQYHLASLRHGRHNLSLHRRALVFRPSAVEEPCDASISPT